MTKWWLTFLITLCGACALLLLLLHLTFLLFIIILLFYYFFSSYIFALLMFLIFGIVYSDQLLSYVDSLVAFRCCCHYL